MRPNSNIFYFLFLLLPFFAQAQIWNGQDTIYGNEWIVANQAYFKIKVSEDGFYKITYDQLVSAGIPANTIATNQWELIHQGEKTPLFVSSENTLQSGDYLAFYGKKNRGELDYHLFRNPDSEQLNPKYSLVNETAAYYLSWSTIGSTDNFISIENTLSVPFSPASYVWKNSEVVFSNAFIKEYYRYSGVSIYYSHYSIGEGFGSRSENQLLDDDSVTQTVEIPHAPIYTAGPAATLESRYVAALGNHEQAVRFNDIPIHSASFFNWAMQTIDVPINMADFNDNAATVTWEGSFDDRDEVSIGFVSLKYPAIPTAVNQATLQFQLNASTVSQDVEISNWGTNNVSIHVFDLTNRVHLMANQEGEILQFTLPPSAQEREIVLISEDAFSNSILETTDLSLPDLSTVEYLILTNSLLQTGPTDQVQAYANYRASSAGGAFETAVVNTDNLYDLFSFGVSEHPIAIRNFVHWIKKQNPAFEYLFIIGKGREYIDIRSEEAFNTAYGETFFVPSFGYPSSDNLLVSKSENPTPIISLGRLPAINSAEVSLYLSKIQDLEAQTNTGQTIDEKAWMKNVLHLGGGGTPSEQQSIRNLLQAMENEIQLNKFGGEVSAFYKTSTESIQASTSDLIFDRINEGVSMLTFFGHSSAGTFDFNIDNSDNYFNTAKYPLMISLGCYSGNMFEGFRSIGERFIFLEDRGAGAFAASRGVGFIHALGAFARQYYKHIGGEYYGAGIGDGIRETIRSYETATDIAFGTMIEQFSLQGDPALKLHPSPGPDYTCDASSAQFTPKIINIQKDSFDFELDIYNLGQGINDSLMVKVEQQLPSGEIVSHGLHEITAPRYAETFRLTLPTLERTSVGKNSLFVTLDAANDIMELPIGAAENNNQLVRSNGQLGVPFFIVDNTANPVCPPEFALVGKENITLKASTLDVFSPVQKYFMEVDTSILFDTPLSTTTIEQRGGLLEWTPTISWQDSTVYYWRASPDSTNTNSAGFVWESSSFTYIENIQSGWGQGDWGQWEEGDFNLMFLDEDKDWAFAQNQVNIRIKNKIWDPNDRPGLVYNSESLAGSVRPWNYLSEGMAAVVYVQDDPNGFWHNPPPGDLFNAGDYGVTTGGTRVFAFPTETIEQRANFITFLDEVVPEEAYVFLFTILKNEAPNIYAEDWALDSLTTGRNIFQVLEEQDANFARQLENFGSVPYIFQYRKNMEVIAEAISPDPLGEINTGFSLPLTLPSGYYTTPVIGPVKAWEQVNWQFKTQTSADSNLLIIYAGNEVQALDSITEVSLNTLNGHLVLADYGIDEEAFLQLKWFAYDDLEKSPAQMDYLHVIHQHLPDLAINPALVYSSPGDTLQQGAPYELQVAMTNVSDVAITDSVELNYVWQDQTGGILDETIKIPPLGSESSFTWDVNLDTKNTNIDQQIFIELNPEDTPKERYRFNNSASLLFYLDKDIIAPIVDVTFDGYAILAGDIVSSSPAISIQIEDENPYLQLDDPAIFETRLYYPDGTSTTVIPDGIEVIFTPVQNGTRNQALLQFQPDFVLDGTYRLEVKAKDASENLAGRLLHEVSFEVITEKQLSNVLPYPNPFTTQTRFVYTLTGDATMDNVAIQILTVSGRLIKTITSQELGPLSVGTHQTDYVWDGTDDYGDQLANGVYLYRIIQEGATKEELVPLFSRNNVDSYFANGIGKVVILR